MSDPRLLTRAEVATRLRRPKAWLDRNIKRLQAEHSFPRALPLVGRWDAMAIDNWISRQNGAPATAAASVEPASDLDQAALLDQRAAEMARPRAVH